MYQVVQLGLRREVGTPLEAREGGGEVRKVFPVSSVH